jgi:hypothetical protein
MSRAYVNPFHRRWLASSFVIGIILVVMNVKGIKYYLSSLALAMPRPIVVIYLHIFCMFCKENGGQA